MKYTLLDLTQTILSSMDSDEVDSINDNAEAQQVARIVRTVYYDIVSRANLPENFTLFSLEASGDASKPTLMTRPEDVSSVIWLKYNKATSDDTDPNFQLLTYLSLPDFLNRMHGLNLSDDNVGSFSQTIDTSTVTFLYTDDSPPTCFTSFDDGSVIFDSYDSDVDTTLQKSKTLSWGLKTETFSLTDSYIPALDEQQFSLLLNESKALAFAEMKQVAHAKAEQQARKQWVHLQNSKSAFGTPWTSFDKIPNYGRK